MTRSNLYKTLTKDFTMMNWILRNKIEIEVNCKPPIKFYDVNKISDNLEPEMRWVSKNKIKWNSIELLENKF